MVLFDIDRYSDVLGVNMSVTVLMPGGPVKETSPKVLYLLHGLSDDGTSWLRRTSVERYVDGGNLCVVMPSAGRGFYTDMKAGYAYWTYISCEIPKFIRSVYRVSERRCDTFAAGISMGGYGAVKLGLRRSSDFCRIFSVSGALDMDAHKNILPEFNSVFGENVCGRDNLYELLGSCGSDVGQYPVFSLYCGTEDVFIDDNIKFFKKAEKAGLSISLQTERAGHEWGYWDRVIRDISDIILSEQTV